MMQTYTFNGERTVNTTATFMQYESAVQQAVQTIRVRADGQDLGLYEPGDDIELPTTVGTWQIQPLSQTLRGQVRIGIGRVRSSSIRSAVQVIDGGRARTLNDEAFLGYAGETAGAGAVPVVQLRNPETSGRRAIIKAIRLGSNVAGLVRIGRHDTQLPTGPSNPTNKRMGGPSSITKMYRNTPAGAGPGVSFETISLGSNITLPITLQEPITLDEGQGIVGWHEQLASTLTMAIEFVEEVVT